mmetsp:Transcript_10030/g.28942  ORF Transcript_10030/g.28942 Transcript_10030/m.28942 type:complete len:601 (-) Transcript_10030:420-2222(-)
MPRSRWRSLRAALCVAVCVSAAVASSLDESFLQSRDSRPPSAFTPSFRPIRRSLTRPRASVATAEPEAAVAAEQSDLPSVAKRQRVLSGIQPTGALHLGNYVGAIRQWVKNQDKYDSFFCAVDLHAITLPHTPSKLRQETLQATALYVACGIDPDRSSVFVQSHVPAHTELTWLLNCITPVGWLERMIQFKEKSRKLSAENIGVGLFGYPVLMASDILLYKAEVVPVGEDQVQHIELTRDVARRFNDLFCKRQRRKDVFVEPETLLVKEGARVMSLLDGTAKMSKSDPNEGSRINLLDTPETIQKKIKKCKTDPVQGLEYGNPDRPECTNLLTMLSAISDQPVDAILQQYGDLGWGAFKPVLTDALVEHLGPIQQRYRNLVSDPSYLQSILRQGAEKANAVASQTLSEAKDAMGYLSLDDVSSLRLESAEEGSGEREKGDISLLEIRVGRILEVERHPDADSLYVEKVDLGEGEPRTIVSGLVPYLSQEELQGRNVIVLCNLKPRAMRGIKSEGMLLCSSSPDGTRVAPLSPPEGAALGELVTFDGWASEPVAPGNKAGKAFDRVAEDLSVGEQGVATFRSVPFQTSAGACTSEIPGKIS